jgi:hypothetical protein
MSLLHWFKKHLVDDAHIWHRLWSMRLAIFTTFLSGATLAFEAMPDRFKDAFPHWTLVALASVTTFMGGSTAVARMLKQPSLQSPDSVPMPVTVPPPASHGVASS